MAISGKIEQLRGDIVLTAEEHDKTIDDLAAAVELLTEFYNWFGPSTGWQLCGQQELHGRVSAFLARLEAK